jgi:hypothetical protein
MITLEQIEAELGPTDRYFEKIKQAILAERLGDRAQWAREIETILLCDFQDVLVVTVNQACEAPVEKGWGQTIDAQLLHYWRGFFKGFMRTRQAWWRNEFYFYFGD